MAPQGLSYLVRHKEWFCITGWSRISRCLAHIINLATQALLAAHSSSKHYDPAKPTDHEPNIDDFLRDEIGLIRAITVKVSDFPFHFFMSLIFPFPRPVPLQNARNVYCTFRPLLRGSQRSLSFLTWRFAGRQPTICSLEDWNLKRYMRYTLCILING